WRRTLHPRALSDACAGGGPGGPPAGGAGGGGGGGGGNVMALDGERGELEEEKKKKKKKKKRKKKKEEEEGAEKTSLPFPARMGETDTAHRAGGRGLSDPWADSVGVRPRTTERHITVHKRLVLAFAVSIVALLAVTMLAVLLSLRFDECGASATPGADGSPAGFPARGANGSFPGSTRGNHHAGEDSSQPEAGGEATPGTPSTQPPSEEEWQPWTQLRLSGHLKPLHYNLMLTAFMENFTFSGEVNVEIACQNATRYVVLHASRVAVEKVQVAEDRVAGAVPVAGFFLYPQTQVLVVVLNRTLDAQRNYNLKIIYNALIENELLGFFRSSYVLHGERRFLGITQFSPTHARKAFPCFDEPIYKATFKISIKHQATYLSLSNMPVETSVFEEDGWVTDHFSQTPLMSTYYLAWAICNFTYRETTTKSGV
ncbi:Thyrotropin-releasing hormone-degrading ectoenzyme, partial [Galemys pyrenaicus]